MMGLGWSELLLLVLCGGAFLIVPTVVVLIIVAAQRRPAEAPAAAWRQAPPPIAPLSPARGPDDADARHTIIALLTQRFCPQCRAPLAADAPEGLCPACLMAGAIGTRAADAADRGLAATTPPSGSQPPAAGEWSNLQQHFPDLEILELLGRGGMGSVYKARQRNLDRLVALKVVPPEAAKDPAFTERFNREGRALARLNHPNIVTVYDFDQKGDVYFLLMEYVDGVNLRHALRASRLAPQEALAIVPQICDALQYAHDQGVVHRDIKPENVLLDRSGRVKIADFGLAKLLGKGPDDFTLTRTQQVMGTPRYMAPEQIERPSTVDHRADIYSLGVVIYEMLTGELPLGRFEPPSHKVQLDVRIDQVVLRTLEKEPDRRYQRASHLKTELASAATWQTPAPAAQPSTPPPQQPSWHTPAPASKPAASDPGG
ncbi:MAG TPA: serine/threonine-protein kinase, partial [Pirellulaceae bacterium]|nr:serine/threonine-protein kinase [Pirellulaceae bacterium]